MNCVGTMAHQWLQAHQVLNKNLRESQRAALHIWRLEYGNQLGIALTDVIGMIPFLRDFDEFFSIGYSGCRHDSGNPFTWGEELIEHYVRMAIDPTTKMAVFSDGLTIMKALDLRDYFAGRIKTSFGIGGGLTNNIGITPYQAVIKMIECNGKPVAKISDTPGKAVCKDPAFLEHLKTTFQT